MATSRRQRSRQGSFSRDRRERPSRLRGGFLLATLAKDKRELHDLRFAVRAVRDLISTFGRVPRAYAYDRGGWSVGNLRELKRLGVRDVGVAPRGQAEWLVSPRVKSSSSRSGPKSRVESAR